MRSFIQLQVFACICGAVNCAEYQTYDADTVASLALPLKVLHNERAYSSDTYLTGGEPGAPDTVWTFEGECADGGGNDEVVSEGQVLETNNDQLEATESEAVQEADSAEEQQLMSMNEEPENEAHDSLMEDHDPVDEVDQVEPNEIADAEAAQEAAAEAAAETAAEALENAAKADAEMNAEVVKANVEKEEHKVEEAAAALLAEEVVAEEEEENAAAVENAVEQLSEEAEARVKTLVDCTDFIVWRPTRFSVLAPSLVYNDQTNEAYKSEKATFKDVPGESSLWISLGECAEDTITDTVPTIQRVTDDDSLAQAAANVRKAWRLLDPGDIPRLFTDDDGIVEQPLKIAMIASAFAEIVNRQEFLKNEPLQYIQGQQTIATPGARARAPTFGIPFVGAPSVRSSNGFRPAVPFLSPPQQRPAAQTQRPAVVTSPFSALWPNGSIPRLSSDRLSAGNGLYGPPRRYLREEERFGNKLHESLPKEMKRRIWDDFLIDSLNTKGSVEEQNALIRRLERGHNRVHDHHNRILLTSAEIPISQKVDEAANVLEGLIKEGSFSVPIIEAARLYLATLKHHSQTRLMSVIADFTGKDDGDFIKFRKNHIFDHDLEVGLLLLSRLQEALNKE